MGYQVALSPSARRDLRDIVRYISLDSPERALTFGQFLVSNTKRLADFPEMGESCPSLTILSFARLLCGPTGSSIASIMRNAGWMLPDSGMALAGLLTSKASDYLTRCCGLEFVGSSACRA